MGRERAIAVVQVIVPAQALTMMCLFFRCFSGTILSGVCLSPGTGGAPCRQS
ncbi:hypothetical protein CLV76_1338 [Marivita geojedonensis]|nr:hypothetical protein CLV76_1338 [Marivita geojedonensis]